MSKHVWGGGALRRALHLCVTCVSRSSEAAVPCASREKHPHGSVCMVPACVALQVCDALRLCCTWPVASVLAGHQPRLAACAMHAPGAGRPEPCPSSLLHNGFPLSTHNHNLSSRAWPTRSTQTTASPDLALVPPLPPLPPCLFLPGHAGVPRVRRVVCGRHGIPAAVCALPL